MSVSVAVLGAGMVGVSCALALRRAGFEVTLIDRREPGRETSHGNAGVVARSSLVPFNHPGLWSTLPRLLGNRSPGFSYDPAYLLRRLGWATAFLANARFASLERTATALDALIQLSTDVHRQWLTESGARGRLRENGWLLLYRSVAGLEAAAATRAVLQRFGVRVQTLDRVGLAALEPSLAPVFERAVWVQDALSVDDPGEVVRAYAACFVAGGGRLCQGEALGIRPDAGVWRVDLSDAPALQARHLVVALGPWSPALLAPLGLRVPMAFERGYHMHYAGVPGVGLSRPVHDGGGGYVLTPMARGLRLTTGVELADRDAPPDPRPLAAAERAARQVLPLGERLDAEPWLGRRPTLPDSRPAIGAVTGLPGLWLAFGHQHIGFSTGPGTGMLLAALVRGATPPIDPRPFRPERFGGLAARAGRGRSG